LSKSLVDTEVLPPCSKSPAAWAYLKPDYSNRL